MTGFKPRFVIYFDTAGGSSWEIVDSERGGSARLFADSSSSESTSQTAIEFLPNGFQPKASYGGNNESGKTYIYLAIGDDEIGSDEDCLVDVPNAVTADADATDTTGGYQRGNYATLNPLKKSSEVTLSNGNLDISTSSTSNKCKVFGTIGVSSGKWYYEVTIGSNYRGSFGWATSQDSSLAGQPGDSTGDYALTFDGSKIVSDSYTSGYGVAFTSGMVVGVRVDADTGEIGFSQDGSDKGTAFTAGAGNTYWPIVGDASSGGTFDGSVNFGQTRFKYGLPSGYAALNTTALPAATIADGSTATDVALYTGNGTSQSITSINHSPDLVWIKDRSAARSHNLYDTVRGATKLIASNTTGAEVTNSNGLTSFDTNGFSVGSKNGNNASGETFVAWAWDAGSSTVSNTDGSITSSVRANPSAGFSIVKYTMGSSDITVGHGLNAEPELIITRRYSAADSWITYHSALGKSKYLFLNGTNAAFTDTADAFTSTNSSVFDARQGLINAGDCIAYCFAPVAGYSAFGSYEATVQLMVRLFIPGLGQNLFCRNALTLQELRGISLIPSEALSMLLVSPCTLTQLLLRVLLIYLIFCQTDSN